jgi:Spy/CpxP family protein refolding chaperone
MLRIAAGLLLTLAAITGFQVWAQTQPQGVQQQPSGQQPPSSQAPSPSQPPASSAPQSPQAGAQLSVDDQATQALERLGPELNLTPDQKTKLHPILAGEIQLARDLRADTTMTMEQKQTKFRQTVVADHDKIQAILTPEQQQKLADMNQAAGKQPPSDKEPPK